jgi:hypothetical protein
MEKENKLDIKSVHFDLKQYESVAVPKNVIGKNSVIHEIDAIRQKNFETNVDYYVGVEIQESEYLESLDLVSKLSARLSEDHIIDIKSTKKPFFVFKTVFELYSTVIGEPFINWKEFRDRVNLPEMTLKFTTVNYTRFTRDGLNKLLAKVVALKKFETYLTSENTASLFFTWVKAILKICIYLHKLSRKEKAVDKERQTSKLRLIVTDKLDSRTDSKQIIGVITNSAKELYSPDYEEGSDKAGENVYLTAVKSDNVLKTSSTQTRGATARCQKLPKLNEKKTLNNTVVKEKYIHMDYNCLIEKRQRDLKVLQSLPLYKFKTFNKLREFFNGKSGVGFKELVNKNTEDIKHKALNNPENFEKVLTMVAEGRYGIDHQVTSSLFDHFKIK